MNLWTVESETISWETILYSKKEREDNCSVDETVSGNAETVRVASLLIETNGPNPIIIFLLLISLNSSIAKKKKMEREDICSVDETVITSLIWIETE